jgi:hypothetical protein
MNDDGKVAAVGGEKDIFLTINGMKIVKRENPGLQGEGLRKRAWNIGRGGSIPIDPTRLRIAFGGMYLQRGAGHERQMTSTLDPLRNDQRDNCQKSAANLVASF